MVKIEEVAIVKCNSYNQKQVDKAIQKALDLIDFKFKKNLKVLIKPNAVGKFPKKQIATTTHPSLIEAVCKILKKHNCKIFIGDSPFTNPEDSFKASGIDRVAKKYGKLIIFEQDKLVNINDKNAKILKKFKLPSILKKVDLIINIPKLKTHVLTKYTGAIKNLYGCIPGGEKQRFHNHALGDEKFSKILVDVYQNIKPELNIMDGIIGMEGDGPSSGEAINSKLILASKNAVALDIACSEIIGYDVKRVYAIKEAVKRKLYATFKFKLVGLNKLPLINFRKPTSHEKEGAVKRMKGLIKEKPIICDESKCVKCGLCASKCPTHSITLKPCPVINKKTCIRCFCCIEICPQDALMLKKG